MFTSQVVYYFIAQKNVLSQILLSNLAEIHRLPHVLLPRDVCIRCFLFGLT